MQTRERNAVSYYRSGLWARTCLFRRFTEACAS